MASKVFIVTGASKGLGAAIAQALLSQSHKVVVTARSKEPLDALQQANTDNVQVVAGDITKSEVCIRNGMAVILIAMLIVYALRTRWRRA
jgi:NADP-dependent 3-hydroxy acid dehydrogenase YdfG